eukprot:14474001-Heterocapsa_arctica.AAC.1
MEDVVVVQDVLDLAPRRPGRPPRSATVLRYHVEFRGAAGVVVVVVRVEVEVEVVAVALLVE